MLVANLGSGRAPNELTSERDQWHRVLTLNLYAPMDLRSGIVGPSARTCDRHRRTGVLRGSCPQLQAGVEEWLSQ